MTLNKSSSVTFSIAGNGSNFSLSFSLSETSADGADAVGQPQLVPTAWTAVNVGNCAPAEKICIRNNDPTNYVQLATSNAGAGLFARLKPGECAFWPLDPATTLYAKANAAACAITVVASEL